MQIREIEQRSTALIPLDHPEVLRPVASHWEYSAIRARLDRDRSAQDTLLGGLRLLLDHPRLERISANRVDATAPYWNNPFFRADARVAYAMAAYYAPRTILEVGAGNSSKFFRRAILDFDLSTKLVAIDPVPRGAARRDRPPLSGAASGGSSLTF